MQQHGSKYFARRPLPQLFCPQTPLPNILPTDPHPRPLGGIKRSKFNFFEYSHVA